MRIFAARSSTRLTLYILIAVLTSIVGDLRSWSSWEDLNGYRAFVGSLAAILQGLVTMRAFLDQSLSKETHGQA